MATIQIPPVLRSAVGGVKNVDAHGTTLGDVLGDLYGRYPALREQIKPGDDGLSRNVNIYVDDEDVRTLQGVATSVGDDARVIILPAMAGGSC